MNEIFNFRRNDQDNYYDILGCSVHSSEEQIITEYKILALKYHPDKHNNNELFNQKFQKIKKAKEILCDQEKRKLYDKWLDNGVSMSFQQFLNYSRNCAQSFHWANNKSEPMITFKDSTSLNLDNNIENKEFIYENKKINFETDYSIESFQNDSLKGILHKFRNYEI